MNVEKNRFHVTKEQAIRVGRKMMLTALFYALLFMFSSDSVSAQTVNFDQTGQIRLVISEPPPPQTPPKQNVVTDIGQMFQNSAGEKENFYFTYKTSENGKVTEKWVALPNDKSLSRLSNQTVRISGSLENNRLQDVSLTELNALPENYLTNPPPTVGLYKVVAVPLTIQPLPARGAASYKTGNSSATPEAIRYNLFNAPDAVNKFYLEASYKKFGFTGVRHPQADVVPVTIQATVSTNCQEQIVTQFTPIVQQRLREQNIETTDGSVDLGIIIFNDTPNCPPYPFATRGALGQRGAPQWLWMPESWFVTGPLILAHEIAHTLGGNHPVTLRCADFNNPQNCVIEDAADRDIMTSGGRFYLMPNNYERRRWGWHPPGALDSPSNTSADLFSLHSPIASFIKDSVKQKRFYFRNLNGAFFERDVYPESRRNSGQFERYREADESFRSGIAVRIGHRNYGDPSVASILIVPDANGQVEDAPLRENEQVPIGGVVVKCVGENNPRRGTLMQIQ